MVKKIVNLFQNWHVVDLVVVCVILHLKQRVAVKFLDFESVPNVVNIE